jgi:hypothetical protein
MENATYEWFLPDDNEPEDRESPLAKYLRIVLNDSKFENASVDAMCDLLDVPVLEEEQKANHVKILLNCIPTRVFRKKKDVLRFLNILLEKYQTSCVESNIFENTYASLVGGLREENVPYRVKGKLSRDCNVLSFSIRLTKEQIAKHNVYIFYEMGCSSFCTPTDEGVFCTMRPERAKFLMEKDEMNPRWRLFLTLNMHLFGNVDLDISLTNIARMEDNLVDTNKYTLKINLDTHILLKEIAMLRLCRELIIQKEALIKRRLISAMRGSAMVRSLPVESVRNGYYETYPGKAPETRVVLDGSIMRIPNVWHKRAEVGSGFGRRSMFQTSKVSAPYDDSHTSPPTSKGRIEYKNDVRVKILKTPESGTTVLNLTCEFLPVVSLQNRLDDDVFPTGRNETWWRSYIKDIIPNDKECAKDFEKFVMPPNEVKEYVESRDGEVRWQRHFCRDVFGSYDHDSSTGGKHVTKKRSPEPIRYAGSNWPLQSQKENVSVFESATTLFSKNEVWIQIGSKTNVKYETTTREQQERHAKIMAYDTVCNFVALLENRIVAERDHKSLTVLQKFKNPSTWDRLVATINGDSLGSIDHLTMVKCDEKKENDGSTSRGVHSRVLAINKSLSPSFRRFCDCRYYDAAAFADASPKKWRSRALYELAAMRFAPAVLKITKPYEFKMSFDNYKMVAENSFNSLQRPKYLFFIEREIYETQSFVDSRLAKKSRVFERHPRADFQEGVFAAGLGDSVCMLMVTTRANEKERRARLDYYKVLERFCVENAFSRQEKKQTAIKSSDGEKRTFRSNAISFYALKNWLHDKDCANAGFKTLDKIDESYAFRLTEKCGQSGLNFYSKLSRGGVLDDAAYLNRILKCDLNVENRKILIPWHFLNLNRVKRSGCCEEEDNGNGVCPALWERISKTKHTTNTKECERLHSQEHVCGVADDSKDMLLDATWFADSWDAGKISGLLPNYGCYSLLARIMCFHFGIPFVDPSCELVHGNLHDETSRDGKWGVFGDWEEWCRSRKRKDAIFYEKLASYHLNVVLEGTKKLTSRCESEEEIERLEKEKRILLSAILECDSSEPLISSFRPSLQTTRGVRLTLKTDEDYENGLKMHLWRTIEKVGHTENDNDACGSAQETFFLGGTTFSMLDSNRWHPKDDAWTFDPKHKESNESYYRLLLDPSKFKEAKKAASFYSFRVWGYFDDRKSRNAQNRLCYIKGVLEKLSKTHEGKAVRLGGAMDSKDGCTWSAICSSLRILCENDNDNDDCIGFESIDPFLFVENMKKRFSRDEKLADLASFTTCYFSERSVTPGQKTTMDRMGVLEGAAVEIYLLGVFWNWLIKITLDSLLLNYKVENDLKKTLFRSRQSSKIFIRSFFMGLEHLERGRTNYDACECNVCKTETLISITLNGGWMHEKDVFLENIEARRDKKKSKNPLRNPFRRGNSFCNVRRSLLPEENDKNSNPLEFNILRERASEIVEEGANLNFWTFCAHKKYSHLTPCRIPKEASQETIHSTLATLRERYYSCANWSLEIFYQHSMRAEATFYEKEPALIKNVRKALVVYPTFIEEGSKTSDRAVWFDYVEIIDARVMGFDDTVEAFFALTPKIPKVEIKATLRYIFQPPLRDVSFSNLEERIREEFCQSYSARRLPDRLKRAVRSGAVSKFFEPVLGQYAVDRWARLTFGSLLMRLYYNLENYDPRRTLDNDGESIKEKLFLKLKRISEEICQRIKTTESPNGLFDPPYPSSSSLKDGDVKDRKRTSYLAFAGVQGGAKCSFACAFTPDPAKEFDSKDVDPFGDFASPVKFECVKCSEVLSEEEMIRLNKDAMDLYDALNLYVTFLLCDPTTVTEEPSNGQQYKAEEESSTAEKMRLQWENVKRRTENCQSSCYEERDLLICFYGIFLYKLSLEFDSLESKNKTPVAAVVDRPSGRDKRKKKRHRTDSEGNWGKTSQEKSVAEEKRHFSGLLSVTNVGWYDGVGAYDTINVHDNTEPAVFNEKREEIKKSARWVDSAL